MSGTGRGFMRAARTTASAARESAFVLGLLLFAACARTQKDPRIAENASPHIVARVIERATDASCDRGEIIETLKCKLTPAQRIGCVYAEVGDAIDNPLTRTRRETFDCNTLVDEDEERVLVSSQPLRHVKFFTDERKERVVLQAGESAWLFLFFNNQLLDSRTLSGTAVTYFNTMGELNWSTVPSLLDVVPAHAEHFSNDDLDALTAATPDGGAKLETAIVAAFAERNLTPDDPDWTRLYERLPPARQKDIADEIISSVETGDSEAIGWAQIVPVPREPLIEALVTANSSDDDSQEVPEAFNLLARLAPHRLENLACHRLEKAWFDNIEGDLSMSTVALALIAREKLRCAWVEPWLLRHSCSWQLREENDELYLPTAPLASQKTRERIIAVELTLNDFPQDEDGGVEDEEDEEEEENEEDGYASEPWGPLLLAAGYAQGPLPREFELKNARRFYKRVYVEKDDDNDLCRAAGDEIIDWVCELPVSMHELHRNTCVITLDDEKRVMRLALERK